MKLAIYTHMPLTNQYTGNLGITMFMFPLIKELKKLGHEITYCGKVAENYKRNPFCELMGLKPYNLSICDDVTVSKDVGDCDALLVYNRPPEVLEEFSEQNRFINQFVSNGKPVGIWDGDLWASSIPSELRRGSTLLRPYITDRNDRNFGKAIHFPYFVHDFYNDYDPGEWDGYEEEWLPVHKKIDYVYIGNFYNRFEEFKEKFKNLDGNIVVAGNWLKNEKKWNKSLQLKNVLYIGEIPHNYSIPLYATSKKTFYIIPDKYSEVGMETSRIYEAAMAGCETGDKKMSELTHVSRAVETLLEVLGK